MARAADWRNTRSAEHRGETPMQRLAWGILILCLILAGVAPGHAQDTPATLAEQYKALLKDYDRASSSGVPLTDAERLKFIGQVSKHRHALALKFLELAAKNHDDPIALDALIQAVWQVNT